MEREARGAWKGCVFRLSHKICFQGAQRLTLLNKMRGAYLRREALFAAFSGLTRILTIVTSGFA